MCGAKEEIPVVDWRIVAASVCGTRHKNTSQPCQDSNYWSKLERGIFVAAIADGSGSARLGHLGAHLASRVAVETIHQRYLKSRFCDYSSFEYLLIDSVKASRSAVELESATNNAKLEDLACTLIVLIASKELLAVVQIGDGAVVIKNSDGDLITLSSPHHGEYINETTFLTSNDALNAMQINMCHQSLTHIAAFSDGLQRLALKMPEASPHLPFFTPLFHFISNMENLTEARTQVAELLGSSRVQERTDDDVTLLLAALIN